MGLDSALDTARDLIERYHWEALVVLGGTHGLWLYTAEEEHHIPCMLDEANKSLVCTMPQLSLWPQRFLKGHLCMMLRHWLTRTGLLSAEEGQEVLDRTLSASLDERAWQMQVSDRDGCT